jgi:hypothetical protein
MARLSSPGETTPPGAPADLHKLWRTRDPKGYHVEYGYCQSCRSQHRGLRRDRPADRRSGLRVVVGRTGQRDINPRLHPTSTEDLRQAQGHSEAVPLRRLSVHDHDRYRTRLVGGLVSQ